MVPVSGRRITRFALVVLPVNSDERNAMRPSLHAKGAPAPEETVKDILNFNLQVTHLRSYSMSPLYRRV